MTDHQVVSRADWQAARDELLQQEKEHTRMADELARQRRELPWVAIEKEYRFDTDDGTQTLAGLFDGRSQLLIYHFMFGPSYQAGCPVNSSMADGLDGLLPHLHARDVTLLLVSQAPLAKLRAYKQRMGWSLPWVSSANTDFNRDFGGSYTEEQVRSWGLDQGGLPPIVALNAAATGTDVAGYLSQSPAVSVFTLQDGAVYETYATAGRGVEFLMGYYPVLDRAPKGRDEGGCVPDLDSPPRRVRLRRGLTARPAEIIDRTRLPAPTRAEWPDGSWTARQGLPRDRRQPRSWVRRGAGAGGRRGPRRAQRPARGHGVVGRRAPRADATAADPVAWIVADNADTATPGRLIAAARDRFGRLDGALISVGGSPPGTVATTTDDAWRSAFESVFLGAVRLARILATDLDGTDLTAQT